MAGQQAHSLVSAVATEIMMHLASHPTAADTAKGIRQWWLMATRKRATAAVVDVALARLVAQGHLAVRRLPCDESLYFRPDTHTEDKA